MMEYESLKHAWRNWGLRVEWKLMQWNSKLVREKFREMLEEARGVEEEQRALREVQQL
jgi:hypothetical protein